MSLINWIDDRFPLSRSEDTRLNSSHITISYAVFCLKKKKNTKKKQKIIKKNTFITIP